MTAPDNTVVKKQKRDVRWCGDLRTVLERGPFDPEPGTEPTLIPTTPEKNAA
jgi:hypothetical protein